MMLDLPRYFELDVALIAIGAALVGYAAQHHIAWLVCFGLVWAFGNFIKAIAKYGD